MLHGKPRARANLLISDGEIAFYKVKVNTPSAASPISKSLAVQKDFNEVSWELSQRSHPFILDHVVGGRPTYPGSFELELAAEAARSLRPHLNVVSFEGTNLMKFIKLPFASSSITIRGSAEVTGESSGETLAKVQILSDFFHSSGKVLQKDIVHFETTVHLSNIQNILPQGIGNPEAVRGIRASDPYLSPEAFVSLKGFFECLADIEIGAYMRRGQFSLRKNPALSLLTGFLTPSIMMDAMLRFSMINLTEEGSMPLYVPIRCREIHLMPGVNDVLLAERGNAVALFGTNPTMQGEMIHNDWVQACDRDGRVLLVARGLEAQRAGEVPLRVLERVAV